MIRELLSSALFQHSSKVQPYKQESIDSIVERIIFFADKKQISTEEIQTEFVNIIGYTIPLLIFEESLTRLVKQNRIDIDKEDKSNDSFRINTTRKREIEINEEQALRKQDKLIDKLFKNSPEKKSNFSDPFWFTVSSIFSSLGDYSAKIVNGQIDKEQILYPVLERSIEKCKKEFKIDYVYFKQKLVEFFSEVNDPLYNEIKCVLSQNYFIAKSIGINPHSETFSKDVFKNHVIYLDTNVILAIISENNRKHNNAIAFIKAINKIGIKLHLAQITLEEYESWVENEFIRIRATRKQIPEKLQSKISSPVYRDYHQAYTEASKLDNSELDLDEILNSIEVKFFKHKEVLAELTSQDSIIYIDDEWFDTIESDPKFIKLKENVKEKYSEVSEREKTERAVIHDSKLLLWLDKESKESGLNHLFVTTDTSMPLIRFEDNENTNNIILEAILQWLLPLSNGNLEGDIERTISEILKQKILPNEFLFEIKDFLIFEHLHMECQELPSEDVENCILYLKKNAAGLNPNNPADREKFASEIAKYFIDPGKKFRIELSEKEKENEQLKNNLGDVHRLLSDLKEKYTEKEEEITDLKNRHNEDLKNISEGHNQEIKSIKGVLSGLEEEMQVLWRERIVIEGEKAYKIWQRPGKISFVLSILILIFGVLQLLPDWNLNYPAKLITWINQLKAINEAKYYLIITINGFFVTTLIVTLFIFSYNRLFNSEIKNKKKKELGLID